MSWTQVTEEELTPAERLEASEKENQTKGGYG
jgi:hypothetical protein